MKMGILYLLFPLILAGTYTFASQIELPKDPRPSRQLSDDYYKNQQQKNLEKKRGIRARQSGDPDNRYDYWAKKRDEELDSLSTEEASLNFGINLGLGLLGFAEVQGPREGYNIDPPVFARAFWLISENKDKDSLKLWIGMRAAFISGWGSYEKIPGRFGFAYYGPMIALGKFNPVNPESLDGKTTVVPARTGYMVLMGIAALSQFGDVGKSVEITKKDFENANGFDSPGIWVEFQYSWLHFKSIEISAFGGIQTGQQKMFIYIGSNIGAWI